MEEYSLNQTKEVLNGPTIEQITVQNQWAAVALDKFHHNSKAIMSFRIDDDIKKVKLSWSSNFTKSAMKEEIDMAHFGGVSIAMFIMSVLLDFKYVEQSEIGDGVDYRFFKEMPDDNDLNFLNNDHYVEISGILEETKTNTIQRRLKEKHNQIEKGEKRNDSSSVIVSLFSKPMSVKETHK